MDELSNDEDISSGANMRKLISKDIIVVYLMNKRKKRPQGENSELGSIKIVK